MIYDMESRKEHTTKRPQSERRTQRHYSRRHAHLLPLRVHRGWISRSAVAGSRAIAHGRHSAVGEESARRAPPISSIVPLPSLLARASAIGNSRFYVSLFVAVPRAESNSNRCPRGHSQKLQGMREGGNGTGNRALRESKGEFLLFIYELFIRLVELSLAPTFLSLSLTSSLILSMNASTNSDGEKETEEMGKRAESTRGGTPSPERVPEISRLPGARKKRHFSA